MTQDEIKQRLATIEEFNRLKWDGHDKRSEDRWAEVTSHLQEGRRQFSEIQKELAALPCGANMQRLKDHSDKIDDFRVDVQRQVRAAESRIKVWVLGGIIAALFTIAMASGAVKELLGAGPAPAASPRQVKPAE